ncbi:MAG TPA: GyrI-like domain-containing protein [Mobilitalea sp.]|nr:GyrI-like domain-containing protein [Mobilitalea sp.]
MNYEEITLVEKVVVGISAKTGNSDPQMQEIIGGLWQKFYQTGISDSVKNKVNGYAIGLYSDYEAESYFVTVGNEVSKSDNPELSVKIIPAGRYAKFVVKGNMITAVAAAWNEIWQMKLNRSFTGDFEEYLNGDMENAEINIYIALK